MPFSYPQGATRMHAEPAWSRSVKLLRLFHRFQDRAGQLPGAVDRQLDGRPPAQTVAAVDEVDVDGVVERRVERVVVGHDRLHDRIPTLWSLAAARDVGA